MFRRRLSMVLCVLSLALCLITAGLWVRSYWRYDQVNWFGPTWGLNGTSGGGIVAFMAGPVYRGPGAVTLAPGWRYMSYPPPVGGGVWAQVRIARYARLSRLGIAYDPNRLVTAPRAPPFYSSHRLYLPHWLLLILTAIPPALWWRRRRSRLRTLSGRCTVCGYDLQATPQRCPECGNVPIPAWAG